MILENGRLDMQAERDISHRELKLSVKQFESLGYYDFVSYLGVPYYHIGVLISTKKLAELCRTESAKKS